MIPSLSHRFTRRNRSGVALLVAITTMAMLTVLISEITYVSRMRFMTAHHQNISQRNTLKKMKPNSIHMFHEW